MDLGKQSYFPGHPSFVYKMRTIEVSVGGLLETIALHMKLGTLEVINY